ncbi:hypothetical protein BH09ACT2_BH09ACT2_09240 [soil metagenome]
MTDRDPLGAVIIAAHNESSVIARCLEALTPAIAAGRIQVLVVCNGCDDDTAHIARRFDGVEVLELEVASKTAALRAGDIAAIAGPRIYLDADIELSASSAIAVLESLGRGPALAGRPPLRFDYSRASVLVRSWYRIRERLPSIADVLWGAGTYALSEKGRARFSEFPEIVSDDLFIDSLFDDDEVVIVNTDPVVVRTPRTTSDLLKILVRTYRTQAEVAGAAPSGPVSTGQREQLRDIGRLLRQHPRYAAASVVYIVLIAYARSKAKSTRSETSWERDDSSREETPR